MYKYECLSLSLSVYKFTMLVFPLCILYIVFKKRTLGTFAPT